MKPTVVLVAAAVIHAGVIGSFALRAQSAAPAPAAERGIDFQKDIVPILATHCTSCHAGSRPHGGMNLTFKDEAEARARLKDDDEFWDRVAAEISTKQMPPAGRTPPTDAQRERLVEWIYNNVMTTGGTPDPGPFVVRRLNNREYANTVRDLLYLPASFDVTADFPADERGDGFDNNAARSPFRRC